MIINFIQRLELNYFLLAPPLVRCSRGQSVFQPLEATSRAHPFPHRHAALHSGRALVSITVDISLLYGRSRSRMSLA